MKPRSLAVVGLALAGAFGAALILRAGPDAQKDAAEARRSLRQQGFKTDLSDFDFSTDYETATRAGALTNVAYTRPTVLLQPCGTECAIVAWKEANFEEPEGYQNLPPVEEVLVTNQANLDAACAAVLAGPIHFPLTAKHGNSMLLVHLAPLVTLSQTLAARIIVDLREKHYSAAWTNLLALTRLTTAWEPEPVEISHLVRFNLARTGWKVAWQALQAHNWSEEQLMALQREWEASDFFKGLSETVAFTRASTVDTCIRERQAPPAPGIPFKDTLENALRSPSSLAADARQRWKRAQYRATGTYEDEHDLLVFFCDREIELRKAITAATWLGMRVFPGVTNAVPFRSKHSSRMQAMFNSRQISIAMLLEGKSFLGRAAETEARRRLVVAAIGLERYRLGHGSYPKDLQSLVPDVLKSVPVDFMDGQPLRFRLSELGAFVLYSVGLDGVDDGGKFSPAKEERYEYPNREPADGPDLIWPRAASDAETRAFRLEQTRAKQELIGSSEREAGEREREAEERRREIIAELAEIYTNGGTPKISDPKVEGGLLSQVLRNKAIAGSPLRIDQMLALRRVITGKEPDIATFELPMSYDAATNVGTLRLLCDADPREQSPNEEAELQECERATNGNCRLVWNTTYDPPGKHFLQAELSIDRWRRRSRLRNQEPEEITVKGPLFAFVSTNVIQFFPMGDVYSDKGAFFHVKLAQPVGSYSLEITSPSGEHIHTITGSTTNGIVEVHWDLIYDGGKRYTNDSLNSTWTVTFPAPPAPASTNTP
ncbi:MAG TPA: hypothetical protein VJA21_27060 [Verrucomicrobiae bacterium]